MVWHQVMLGTVIAIMPVVEAGAYKAYVSNEKGNSVSVIDTASNSVVNTIFLGRDAGLPQGVAITPH